MGQLPDRLRCRAACSCSRVLGPRLAGRRVPARRGCCWPQARRSTSSRCRPPSAGSSARSCGPPGSPCRSPRRPTGPLVVPGHAGRRAARRAARPRDVVLRTAGAAVLAPPSETPDGWVHWRVAPALSGYRPSPFGPIVAAVVAAVEVYDRRPPPRRGRRALVARLALAAADRPVRAEGHRDAHNGAAPEGALLPRRAAAPTFSAGAGRQRTPAPARASLPRAAGTMESCRPHRRPPRPVRTSPPPPSGRGPGASPSRSGWASGGARRQGPRPAPDEDAGHRAPAGRDRGLPARPLGRGRRGARLGGLRPRHGRGRDGRRAGRLVRRHRALPAADGPADPAHRDHPAQEGPARRQPRRLRRRELPGRGRRARQARAHRGRPARG